MIASDLVIGYDNKVHPRYDAVNSDQSQLTVYGGYVPKSAAPDERKNPEWQDAIRRAKYEYERAHTADLTYTMIGEQMGRLLKKKAFSKQAVSNWFHGTRPQPQNFVALAHILEIPEERIPALLRALAASPAPIAASTEGVRPTARRNKTRHGAKKRRAG